MNPDFALPPPGFLCFRVGWRCEADLPESGGLTSKQKKQNLPGLQTTKVGETKGKADSLPVNREDAVVESDHKECCNIPRVNSHMETNQDHITSIRTMKDP